MTINPYESPTDSDDKERVPWQLRLPVIELLVIWSIDLVLVSLCLTGPPHNELHRWLGRAVIISTFALAAMTALYFVVWASVRVANALGNKSRE